MKGIPFFHAGDEILRSKSLDRDSYNSGDWFSRLDFNVWITYRTKREKRTQLATISTHSIHVFNVWITYRTIQPIFQHIRRKLTDSSSSPHRFSGIPLKKFEFDKYEQLFFGTNILNMPGFCLMFSTYDLAVISLCKFFFE